MCLSIPAQIISVDGDFASVSVGGAIYRAGIQMISNPEVGDYVLLHAGFAIQRISDEEALETIHLINEMNDQGNQHKSK
jgi:hydrogenase expression/formation protein HypC